MEKHVLDVQWKNVLLSSLWGWWIWVRLHICILSIWEMPVQRLWGSAVTEVHRYCLGKHRWERATHDWWGGKRNFAWVLGRRTGGVFLPCSTPLKPRPRQEARKITASRLGALPRNGNGWQIFSRRCPEKVLVVFFGAVPRINNGVILGQTDPESACSKLSDVPFGARGIHLEIKRSRSVYAFVRLRAGTDWVSTPRRKIKRRRSKWFPMVDCPNFPLKFQSSASHRMCRPNIILLIITTAITIAIALVLLMLRLLQVLWLLVQLTMHDTLFLWLLQSLLLVQCPISYFLFTIY